MDTSQRSADRYDMSRTTLDTWPAEPHTHTHTHSLWSLSSPAHSSTVQTCAVLIFVA